MGKNEIELGKQWLIEAGELIREHIHEQLAVSTKSSRQDIVTEMDGRVQNFLIAKIHSVYPEDKILAEENGKSELEDISGRVWILDPIDGTLNFYYQKSNFAIMLGLYVDGVGKLGFIYDVMREEMYYGGRGLGVWKNGRQLEMVENTALSQGLIGINAYMYAENIEHTREIGDESMGVRVYGSAAMEFISLLQGKIIAYISKLAPWDWAAGSVLAEELGMEFSRLNGEKLPFHDYNPYIVGTKAVMEEVRKYF